MSWQAIVNVDDISFLAKLPRAPQVISFRFNPGPERVGDRLIGAPVEAKFGLRRDQLMPAFERARELGAGRFGLHAMIASNVLTVEPLLATVQMLLEIEHELARTRGIACEFINAGGGLGIPYRPGDPSFDVEASCARRGRATARPHRRTRAASRSCSWRRGGSSPDRTGCW